MPALLPSGAAPGTTVAGLPLALNPDDYFNFLLLSPNQAYFSTSLGALDSDGKALATIDVPPGTNPETSLSAFLPLFFGL